MTGVVLRGDDVLLVRGRDTGEWSLVTGIIEPGQQPSDALEREVLEETGVRARATRLLWVRALPPVTYPNGDRAQYLDVLFECEHVAGEPWPADEENTEAAWYPLTGTPALTRHSRLALEEYLSTAGPVLFRSDRVHDDGSDGLGVTAPTGQAG